VKRLPALGLQGLQIRAARASLCADLGIYYLDMTTCIPLVESGFHGLLDAAGVPLTDVGGGRQVYDTITISQYALALHDLYQHDRQEVHAQKFAIQLEAVVARIEREGEWRGFLIHQWTNLKYRRLRTPWVSALAQGMAISVLLRGYRLWSHENLLKEAEAVFRAMARPIETGGVRAADRCGHLWFEEYPLTPPVHVLNGFIFALWGVLDFARVTGDPDARKWWSEGIETLKAHIPDFDSGFWSLYDLRYRELASLHYHANIHPPQLEAMYALTGERIFLQYARRWRRFAHSWRCRVLWWIGLRIGALKRGWRFD
jgi:heparosan-N-sulfate-glucuronate 5-epimerase